MKDRDVFYLQYLVAFLLSLYFIMNGLIDTTTPYVNIFSCYGQQLKYLFASLYPFPQEMLNTQTSELCICWI